MNLIRHSACVMLLVSTSLATVGQNLTEKKLSTDPQAKPAAEQKILEPTERKILSVLSQGLELQRSISDENARVGIKAAIGDLLWNYDEPRARVLLEEAFQPIANVKLANNSSARAAAQQRFWILGMIARHDSALALKLQQSIEITSSADSRSPSDNASYVLTLSVLLGSGQNPEKDGHILEQAVKPFVERGDLKSVIPVLRSIRYKNANVADQLFIQALEKAKSGQPRFEELRWLAWYLFPAFGDGVFSFSSGPVGRDPYEAIQISTAVVQQFLDFAYAAVFSRLEASLSDADGARLDPRSSFDYALPKLLTPYFDHFMPDRAAAFRARVEEVRRRVRGEDQDALALNEPGTVQELLARVERLSDPRQKNRLYEKAASQASFARNYDQAAAILEKISDEVLRSRQKAMLRERVSNDRLDEIRKLIQDGDFDRAQELISEIRISPTRMWMFQSLIGAASRKDKGLATEMLAEASRLAANIQNGTERALHLIGLARVSGIIDTDRGFEEMKLAIGEFNRVGIGPEWEMYEEIETTIGDEKTKTTSRVNTGLSAMLDSPDFQWLGTMDFDRGLALAQQIQVREASVFAQLAVCRGALTRLQVMTPKKSTAPEKPPEPKPKQP